MIEEGNQLNDRLAKLLMFMETPAFNELPAQHRSLLALQMNSMTGYSLALCTRLELLGFTLRSTPED